MKIGITGGKGFIGSHLVPVLRKLGHQCELFEEFGARIEDEVAMRRFVKGKNVVIHLAGKNKGSNEELLKVNVLGTQILLSAVQEISPATRIIFASTVQVYLEDSFYGFSKQLAENILQFYASAHEISSISLRFTNLYGFGGKPFYNSVIATFIYQLKSGKSITINGDGSDKRDYLFVEDAVSAIVSTVNCVSTDCFLVLDICSGKKYSLLHIVNILKKYWPTGIKVLTNKQFSTSWKFRLSNKRAMKVLSWEPKVPLEEGMMRLIKNEN